MALQVFRQVSGMEMNIEKTQGVMIGDYVFSSNNVLSIKWSSEIQIFGFNICMQSFMEKDYDRNIIAYLQKNAGSVYKNGPRGILL